MRKNIYFFNIITFKRVILVNNYLAIKTPELQLEEQNSPREILKTL